MPFRLVALQALEGYDLAQKRLLDAEPGSDEERAAVADLARWYEEYERAIEGARVAGTPEPPPFPRETT